MGRRFTKASSERIHIGSATVLAGLDYRYGTIAVCAYPVAITAAYAFVGTNAATGASVTFEIDTSALLLFDGTTGPRGATAPTANKPWVLVVTKATGTATPRFHLYDFSTRTWTHENGNTTAVDGAAMTSLTIGSFANASASDALDAEVWAIGMWNKLVMTDSEVERLARGNWASLEPTFYEQYTDDREVGDMGFSLGRFRARQSARTGTTRGAQKPPPGFRMDARRHRR